MHDPRHATSRHGDRIRASAAASVVAGMTVLTAAVLVFVGLALVGVPVPGPPRFPGPGGPVAFLIAGMVQLVLAAGLALAATGLLTRRRWSWTAAVTAHAVTLVVTGLRPIAAGHLTPDVVPILVLTGAGLLALFSRPARTRLRGRPR